MNNQEIVRNLMSHIQKGEFDKARTLLADDFKFSGPVPKPVNAEDWLAMGVSLRNAFPDLNYNFNIQNEKGEEVMATTQLSGTHRADFDLTSMDMGTIPATNKAFRTDTQNTKINVRDGKVVSWEGEPIEGAGLMAILKQLEVEIPEMATKK